MNSGRLRDREQVLGLLSARDLEAVARLAVDRQGILDILASRLFDSDELIRWRAIEALGSASAARAGSAGASGVEFVRDRLRRLLWSMNHESGSTPWLAPDAAGEIIACIPDLAPEFARLLTQHIAQAPFERGVHRAIARVSSAAPRVYDFLTKYLESAATHPDPCTRTHVRLALASIEPSMKEEMIDLSRGDCRSFQWYDRGPGLLVEATVEQAIMASLSPG